MSVNKIKAYHCGKKRLSNAHATIMLQLAFFLMK